MIYVPNPSTHIYSENNFHFHPLSHSASDCLIFLGLEMAEKKKQSENINNVKEGNRLTKGVMITVYVESPTTRSHKQSKSNSNSIKRRKQVGLESRAYDRRAHLLAYARHLRNNESQSDVVPLPAKQQQSRHHPTKENCLWFQLCCSPTSRELRRSNSQWRYDRMPLNQDKELKSSRKKKSNAKTASPLLRKLKSILKEMSCKKIKL